MNHTNDYKDVKDYLNTTISGVALENDVTDIEDDPCIYWDLTNWHELDKNPKLLDDLMVTDILINKNGHIERISEEEARRILLLNPFINEGEEPDWE